MSVTFLHLTAQDPIIARDGRPFGVGQGNRMRGLSWPTPSVVAGSFRTALVKANPALDFHGDMPEHLKRIAVAGALPTISAELYLPAPNDCAWDETTNKVYRVSPVRLEVGEGVDFPRGALDPVYLTKQQAEDDFKPKTIPAWWPMRKYQEWLAAASSVFSPEWFDTEFLETAQTEIRDHVSLDPPRGAAAEGQIYATVGVHVDRLPRHGVPESRPPRERFAEITLSVRVTIPENGFTHIESLDTWHPLGGERRLVHWRRSDGMDLWTCPEEVRSTLESAAQIRMVLATPAIFGPGWRPGWLDQETLIGKPLGTGPTLKLVAVRSARWKAVSGWSLAEPRGPKPTRRMVPAGSVYFFKKVEGDGSLLAADGWLQPVSDSPQDRQDGFGLALWGTW
jgi:CRISPR-associated protein Cmr3